MSEQNEYQYLFEQMDDAIMGVYEEEVDYSLVVMQIEAETLERERVIISKLIARLPELALLRSVLQRGDKQVSIDEALASLRGRLDGFELRQGERETYYGYIISILSAISAIEISLADPSVVSKRKAQTRILESKIFSHATKLALFDVTNEVLDGPSIDLDDFNDVEEALNEQVKESTRIEQRDMLRRKIRALFDEEFSKYALDPHHHTYTTLARMTSVLIMDTSNLVEVGSVSRHLESVGLSLEQYAVSVEVIKKRLASAN